MQFYVISFVRPHKWFGLWPDITCHVPDRLYGWMDEISNIKRYVQVLPEDGHLDIRNMFKTL
jgi:hypothetical protein